MFGLAAIGTLSIYLSGRKNDGRTESVLTRAPRTRVGADHVELNGRRGAAFRAGRATLRFSLGAHYAPHVHSRRCIAKTPAVLRIIEARLQTRPAKSRSRHWSRDVRARFNEVSASSLLEP